MKTRYNLLLLGALALLLVVPNAASLAQEASTPGEAGQMVLSRPERSSRSDEARLARLTGRIEALRRQLQIPGLSVAVVRDGELVYSGGFGYRDVQDKLPATAKTGYPIASLTKTFASTLLLQQVQAGRLDLNAPVRTYNPEVTGEARVVHYLSHTGGGVPGTRYAYNDIHFAQLTQVLEVAGGESFRSLLVRTIITPLGMDDTYPREGDGAVSEPSRAYRLVGGRVIQSQYPSRRLNTGSGIISNVLDLARYYAAIDQGRFLKPETQALAWQGFVNHQGRTLPYGLGWFIQSYRGEKLVWHYGEIESFSSLVLKVPSRRLTFILLANSSRSSEPFDLGPGVVTRSPFARAFLEAFSN